MSPYVLVEGLKRWWSWASNLNYRHAALSWGRRLHQAITLSGMQTSGIAVDRRRRMLKSDRRHVKRAPGVSSSFQTPAKLSRAGAK